MGKALTSELSCPVTEKDEFANTADLNEAAQNELPLLDLHCLPSSP